MNHPIAFLVFQFCAVMLLSCGHQVKDVSQRALNFGEIAPGQRYILTKDVLKKDNGKLTDALTTLVYTDSSDLSIEDYRESVHKYPDYSIVPSGRVIEVISVKRESYLGGNNTNLILVKVSGDSDCLITSSLVEGTWKNSDLSLSPKYFSRK